MNFFSNSLVYFIKKPLIPIYVAAMSLVYCIVMLFNPLKVFANYYSSFISDDFGDTIIMFSKTVYDYTNLPYILLGIIGISLLLALFSSLLLSGYMNVIHLTVKRIKTDFTDFTKGIKKGFLRSILVFFQLYASFFLFVGFLPLALTPYFILRNSVVDTGNDPRILYLLLILIILVTVVISILIYMSFMFKFPSIFHFSKYPIEKATAALNASYWRTFAKVTLLLLLFAGIEFIMFKIQNRALEFLIGFILYTTYFSFFTVFPFYTFDKLIEPYRLNS